MSTGTSLSQAEVRAARDALDAWVCEVVAWHFDPAAGCPFWLEWAKKAGWDPRQEVHGFDDLKKFGHFQDQWLRGGPVRRWVPQAHADRPIYVFETGGTTGIPKSRIGIEDFRVDYELFSQTLPDEHFPPSSNWADAGAHRTAPAALGRRASCSTPRRYLLLCGSRSRAGSSSSSRRVGWTT